MLRWASLSELSPLAPGGTGVSSNRISAMRHWCGALVMIWLTDTSEPENGPSHCDCAAGGEAGRNCCAGNEGGPDLALLVKVEPAAEERVHLLACDGGDLSARWDRRAGCSSERWPAGDSPARWQSTV